MKLFQVAVTLKPLHTASGDLESKILMQITAVQAPNEYVALTRAVGGGFPGLSDSDYERMEVTVRPFCVG